MNAKLIKEQTEQNWQKKKPVHGQSTLCPGLFFLYKYKRVIKSYNELS